MRHTLIRILPLSPVGLWQTTEPQSLPYKVGITTPAWDLVRTSEGLMVTNIWSFPVYMTSTCSKVATILFITTLGREADQNI